MERRDAYAHQLSATMGHLKRAWHEERGLAAVRRSDHQYDCQHGQGKAYQYGNTTAYLQSLNCGILNVIELEHDEEAEISN